MATTQDLTKPKTLSEIYNQYNTALQQQAQTNIAGQTAVAEANKLSLAEQLKQQRQDYVKNKASIEKDTYLRGRNVLSNLANRGLATSGLAQLGEVQNTVAKGQQINTLADSFNTANKSLEASKANVDSSLQQYINEQNATASTAQAQLALQQNTAEQSQKQTDLSLWENMTAAIQSVTDPAQKQLIIDAYSSTMSNSGTNSTGTTGNIADVVNQIKENPNVISSTGLDNAYKDVDLGKSVVDYASASEGQSITQKEKTAVNKFISNSKYLNVGTEEGALVAQAISDNAGANTATLTNIKTKGGKAQLNDTFKVRFTGSGDEVEVDGRSLMTLIMAGKVKVSNEEALRLLDTKPGSYSSLLSKGDISGNGYDGFLVAYKAYLAKSGQATWTGLGYRTPENLAEEVANANK